VAAPVVSGSREVTTSLYPPGVVQRLPIGGACYTRVTVKLRRLAVAAILAICIGGPIVEMFDQWDHTLQDGNDTEADAVVAALCVGVAIAIGTIAVVARLRALASNSRAHVAVARIISAAVASLAAPIATTSPPIPLRV
jgi:putative Mn2+ efflux pump MntP